MLLLFAQCAIADANTDYRAGADFAKQVEGQGVNTINNFKPDNELPHYTNSPSQSNYYGGISAGGDNGLTRDGVNQWANTDAGKAVNESVINNPKEPISPHAPFIITGKNAEANANNIVGNTTEQCQAQEVNRSEYTNYTCERDLKIEQYCTRTATIVGDWSDDWENKYFEISPTYGRNGRQILFYVAMPSTGTVINAELGVSVQGQTYLMNSKVNFMNTTFNLAYNKNYRLNATGMPVSRGQLIQGTSCSGDGWCIGSVDDLIFGWLVNGRARMVLKLTLRVQTRKWNPRVEWVESCPFSKAEGAIQKTECTEAGSNKTVYVEGQPYSLFQQCWAYRDTYMTQASDPGSCKTYMDNPACTLAARKCAFKSDDGACLHENATYSCETKTAGKVMICGGDIFCLDGECDKKQRGQNGDFAHAVSQLAAVAAAGKDVAALNGVDVRAFTGQARFCKKFAAGFSNCCKDSGWGNNLGLAKCSSDEKALGKAKEQKLTVSVGEFCSKKVLGVCLEKKRSYCQFDSKLAQIVQQQGRAWQLGVDFGEAKNPDCRGITVDELQRINFDGMDFSNFFDDLMNNQKVPPNNEVLKKIQEEINNKIKR